MGSPAGNDEHIGRHAREVYLAEQLKEELAHDHRVGELGLEVRVEGEAVYVTGTVTTDARREAVPEVIRGVRPGADVHSDVTVVASDPGQAERIG